jgi:hypothetical protein
LELGASESCTERQAMVFRSIKLTFRRFDKPFLGPAMRFTLSRDIYLTPGPPVDTGLSIDYDLATPVGLFRFHPLLFFLGPGLKFYNLHQTLNTSINALNSFTDIYLISSARTGFVFFISFTSFFLIVIIPSSYIIWDVLSSLLLGACCSCISGEGKRTKT